MPSVTREDLGAWLLRCNPRLTDLSAFAAGQQTFSTWCVQPNYRSGLMAAGDRVMLWVSGSDRRYGRGIWGVGRLTGQVRRDDGWKVPLDLELLPDGPVTDADLRGAGVDDLEIQRQPQGSNPSWIPAARLDMIAALLGESRSLRCAQPPPAAPRQDRWAG